MYVHIYIYYIYKICTPPCRIRRGSLLIIFVPLLASELDPIAAEIYVGDVHVGLHLLYVLLVAFSWPWFIALMGCATSFPPKGCVLESLILSVAGLFLAIYLFAGRVVRNRPEIHTPSAGEIAGVCLLLAFEVAFFVSIFWRPALPALCRLFHKLSPHRDVKQKSQKTQAARNAQ